MANNWYVYIIKASDDSLYTGVTTDIKRRWKEHNSGTKGAKYFRGRKPKVLLYLAEFPGRSESQREEYRIKKLTKRDKLLLTNAGNNLTSSVKLDIY
ncbi:GIY-YIG nuclease family protein [Aliikangiella sp. G2MR2-5]|uniref:GIY-YIG nuclease family protein n=1 Tax=Aliikangiella sp. G2MR2-5 TaxID=2788943 RepID=UPI0018A94435|nr:GIY-YIG nuclease family protein [Aliikangiella sp. G2MR2-5]